MTTISALPAAPNPLTDSQSNYNSKSLAYTQALPTFITQANAVATEVNADKATVVAQVAAANAAGLSQAATNAATCETKAGIAVAASATAVTAKDAAVAAWTAALAANPDLNPVVRMNPSTITTNTTIPTGYNAYSAGPLTIGESTEVTLNDHAHWSIL